MPSDQSRIIEQAKFTYSTQVQTLKVLKLNTQILSNKDAIPENTLSEQVKMNLIKLKK